VNRRDGAADEAAKSQRRRGRHHRTAGGQFSPSIRFASVMACKHSACLPSASSASPRAKAATNLDCACSWARFTDSGVGWRRSCASSDCGAVGPAAGLDANRLTASRNCAISSPQGPACAKLIVTPRAAQDQDHRGLGYGLAPVALYRNPGFAPVRAQGHPR
jgi:hypothetical protein